MFCWMGRIEIWIWLNLAWLFKHRKKTSLVDMFVQFFFRCLFTLNFILSSWVRLACRKPCTKIHLLFFSTETLFLQGSKEKTNLIYVPVECIHHPERRRSQHQIKTNPISFFGSMSSIGSIEHLFVSFFSLSFFLSLSFSLTPSLFIWHSFCNHIC